MGITIEFIYMVCANFPFIHHTHTHTQTNKQKQKRNIVISKGNMNFLQFEKKVMIFTNKKH